MTSTYTLSMLGLPNVRDLAGLADETALSQGLLYKLSVASDRYYCRFDLPKRGGGTRAILSPSREMKAVQAWILRNILDKVAVHEAAMGFRRGRNVWHNVAPHVRNTYFLCLDIEDFFPSIPYSKVYTIFHALGYSAHVSHILSRLSTCEARLPQGAVTSPALSNIVCIRLDSRIASFVGRRDIVYTRYADDLTFSGASPGSLMAIMPTIRHILDSEGFALNTAKTRRMGPRRRRKITGLVVADGHVGIGRDQKRQVRAAIHHLLTGDMDEEQRERHRAHVQGWLAFMNSVDEPGLRQLHRHYSVLAERRGLPAPDPARPFVLP
jgi:retron-type reverse transcriptase